jgi:hypothetical protein
MDDAWSVSYSTETLIVTNIALQPSYEFIIVIIGLLAIIESSRLV